MGITLCEKAEETPGPSEKETDAWLTPRPRREGRRRGSELSTLQCMTLRGELESGSPVGQHAIRVNMDTQNWVVHQIGEPGVLTLSHAQAKRWTCTTQAEVVGLCGSRQDTFGAQPVRTGLVHSCQSSLLRILETGFGILEKVSLSHYHCWIRWNR